MINVHVCAQPFLFRHCYLQGSTEERAKAGGKYTRGRASGLPEQEQEPRSSDIPACVPSPGPSQEAEAQQTTMRKMSYDPTMWLLEAIEGVFPVTSALLPGSPALVLHDI